MKFKYHNNSNSNRVFENLKNWKIEKENKDVNKMKVRLSPFSNKKKEIHIMVIPIKC